MKTLVIVNPASGLGRGEKFYKKIANAKREFDVVKTTPKYSAYYWVQEALKNNFQEIIPAGGDGIVRETAEALAWKDIPMGIVPLGVGNDSSKGLGIPQDPEEALHVALAGRLMPIDLGMVNGKYFVNSVSFGLDAKIVKDMPFMKAFCRKTGKILPIKFLYLFAALKELLFHIDYPEICLGFSKKEKYETEKRPTTILVAANGPQYGGMFKIAPAARFDDGVLDICWVEKIGRMKIITSLGKLHKGTHNQLPEVYAFTASSLYLRSETELICQMDGEIFESEKEYEINIAPHALNVVVPLVPELIPQSDPDRVAAKASALQPA